ncbi:MULTISPECIES: conjugal transfer protein TraD [Hyphomicrobiales]|uniref:conjugal transfer protein TraD n=1 Tax=Hyphomicrobiales TaxID=356 RepID=UPI000A1055CD|nr:MULTISPECIES: conjugal transfer protein TraD [Hyphomicrobiales]RUV04209.1 conjugal transfer protein TraD [Mesorhizobium sp. M1A.F.Ca.IN.020.03.2.1]RUW22272.1 conjugal transfer protein TraD [Mesorhizobium sp. M4B.F.Ca.ET.013.02.1.1]RWG87102.1 MAG: conjugal transfer protein TraD [Mesorhizobium sp.]RWK18260.1 MAG: conjugal transfer protein TraD [Mesorhizobium sp.]TGV22687.1 conjugal transfer protein TraD [Mesorhizobium sp. M4B.F.Ca.ET.143.01.1.1]
MAANRQKDAHEKILLGGLVVKAGLRDENRAFLMGVLLTAAEQKDNEKLREAMIEKGRRAFEK